MKTLPPVIHAVLRLVAPAILMLWLAVGASEEAAPTAPGFALQECMSGDTLRLYDFKDQPVLLFFFDASSVPDMAAYPYAKEWYRRYSGDGLKIIGIHSPRFEPMKNVVSVRSAVGAAVLDFPVCLDLDGRVREAYAVDELPAYVLLTPGAEVYFRTSEARAYHEIERAVQELLRQLKPDIVHPFVLEPFRPTDDPEAVIRQPTPTVLLGYSSGLIEGCDSTRFGVFADYTDPLEREKSRIYLQGRWKIDEHSITHRQELPGWNDHIRLTYTGKDVWLLTMFEPDKAARVYVKQDRSYLHQTNMGKAMRFDERGQSYIYMRYAVPLHIIANEDFSTHQIEIIPGQGQISLFYLYFEPDVARDQD